MAKIQFKSDLLYKIEELNSALINKTPQLVLYCDALMRMVENDEILFDLEPWHALENARRRSSEMLLRLRTKEGNPLSPYEFVTACYQNGLTAELDSILLAKGVHEFHLHWAGEGCERASINVSSLSLRNQDFIKTAMHILDGYGENIILEIHESSDSITNPGILRMFRKLGVQFALDDVMLNFGDVMRLNDFEGLTSFMKLDHKLLTDEKYRPLLAPTIAFILTSVKDTRIIAEGVSSVDAAKQLYEDFPEIKFVQGRDLPDQMTFSKSWSGQAVF